MSRCFSFTDVKNSCYRFTFIKSGLRSTITDLHDGTVMHCWVPKVREDSKPNLLLIHGFGANALWQWGDIIRFMTPHFNVFVPDLLFFGESYTIRPERTDAFQAQCLMRLMEAHSVRKFSLAGLSYGGFVGYSLAAQFSDAVERVVICSSAVCMEEKDLKEGVFRLSDLEEVATILVPQTPDKLRELMSYTMFRPPPLNLVPSCLLADFIDVSPFQLSDPPVANHILVVIKNAGHAFNVEKPKEYLQNLKSFLIDLQTPPTTSPLKKGNH